MSYVTFSEPAPSASVRNPMAERTDSSSNLSRPPKQEPRTTNVRDADGSHLANKFPVAQLDVESISDILASKLAMSLLGHVLFLKNQVPFPISQLSRMPGGKSSTRASKIRSELLVSLDTLSSHLNTTFTALSTAFAQCLSQNASQEISTVPKTRSYIAILIGPSLSSAKAKVVLAIDGLEARVWGKRDDKHGSDPDNSFDEQDDSETSDSDDEEGDGPETSDSANSSDDDEEDGEGEGEDEEVEESEEENIGNLTSENVPADDDEILPLRAPPLRTYAEEHRFLQAADRILSRTLATHENSLLAELSPTQTHILIRAPRRFKHPTWTPRQNMTTSLEATVSEFLEQSGFGDTASTKNVTNHTKKGKALEGVWITCRGGIDSSLATHDEQYEEEDDEMIWWSWDGKIVGFADW